MEIRSLKDLEKIAHIMDYYGIPKSSELILRVPSVILDDLDFEFHHQYGGVTNSYRHDSRHTTCKRSYLLNGRKFLFV